jgi:hypothetical protein
MIEEVPECMVETYRDCTLILKHKKENMPNDESDGEEVGGGMMREQSSHIMGVISSLDESEEEDDGCELSRQSTRAGGGGS